MRAEPIELMVNGERRETRAETLSDFIEEFGQTRVATAVNGIFVPQRERGERKLQPGDRIEVLSARQGG